MHHQDCSPVRRRRIRGLVLALSSIAALAAHLSVPPSSAQAPQRPPAVVSPEVSEGREVTFRIFAPDVDAAQLASSGDIPGIGFRESKPLVKGEDGIWGVTVGPLAPGAYRYAFNVDGVTVIDPRNPRTSESNESAWSLVNVPGAEWLDTRDVPHGAISEITYWSSTLGRFRRLHVYTPPGYEAGDGEFPILYLLHGAFDSDDSWSTVGRAGFILDNLIADGKAKPMVVVMPHGHTGPFRFGGPMGGDFEKELVADIMPQMEARYRVRKDRDGRAMAGLSMGGAQTINVGIPHLEKFAHLGVFSSGIFGITGGPGGGAPSGPSFEETHGEILGNAELRDGLEHFWFATGRDDFLVETTRATVEMFRKHGFPVTYEETDGGHTWDKWREYLRDFAPLLFQ